MKTFSRIAAIALAVVMLTCCFVGCKKADVAVINTVDDLKGKTIGVQQGTTGDIYAENIENATVERYSKAMDAALALLDNKIDAVIIDLEPAKEIVKANEGLRILEDSPFDPEDYCAAINKNNTDLLALINVTLAEIKSNGVYDNLIKGFIDTPVGERAPYYSDAQIGTEGELVMGTNAEFAPYEYKLDDGTIVGLDVEIAKQIAKKANKTLKILDMEFDSLIVALESGEIDFIMAGYTNKPERAERVNFSDSYYTSNQAVIVLDN